MKPYKINIYLSNISIIDVSFLLTRNFILIFMTFKKARKFFPKYSADPYRVKNTSVA